MLVLVGGHERNADEYTALLDEAGFTDMVVRPTDGMWTVVEATRRWTDHRNPSSTAAASPASLRFDLSHLSRAIAPPGGATRTRRKMGAPGRSRSRRIEHP